MTDMESSLKNMILTLLTITLVASLAVGVVYRVTGRADRRSQSGQNYTGNRKSAPSVRQPARRFSTGLGD